MTMFWKTLVVLTFLIEIARVVGIPGEVKTYAQGPVRHAHGRAPGEYPNAIDFNNLLPPFTIIGQVGFESWQGGRRGYGALKAAVQGAVASDPALNMLYLSTATGKAGRSPDGSSEYKPDKAVPHVALFPNGTFDIGDGTDPSQRPPFAAKVRGHLIVEGDVYAQRCIELPSSTLHSAINR